MWKAPFLLSRHREWYNKLIKDVIYPRVNTNQSIGTDGNDYVCSLTLQYLEGEELSISLEKDAWLTTVQDLDLSSGATRFSRQKRCRIF